MSPVGFVRYPVVFHEKVTTHIMIQPIPLPVWDDATRRWIGDWTAWHAARSSEYESPFYFAMDRFKNEMRPLSRAVVVDSLMKKPPPPPSTLVDDWKRGLLNHTYHAKVPSKLSSDWDYTPWRYNPSGNMFKDHP